MTAATKHPVVRLALLLPTLALLAGCGLLMPPPMDGFSPHGEGPEEIAPERSIVELPDELARERLVVRRQVEDDRMLERVVLANNTATPGENAVLVQTKWRGTPYTRIFMGHFYNPYTSKSVSRRVRDEFGDIGRPMPPTDRGNRRGPYRYVAASGGDVSCVFAWQLIDAQAAVTGETHTYALEFRSCDAERDVDTLLGLFDRIELHPYL